MDIKLKNSHNKRIAVTVVGILLVTLVTLAFFPPIYESTAKRMESPQEQNEQTADGSVNEAVIEKLYRGCFCLYLEERQKQQNTTVADAFLNKSGMVDATYSDAMEEILAVWQNEFDEICWKLDYCVYRSDTDYEKNTDRPLEDVIAYDSSQQKGELQNYYTDFFILSFDENGTFEIETVYDRYIAPSALIKNFQYVDRKNLLQSDMESYGIPGEYKAGKPKNFKVIYGIPNGDNGEITLGFNVENVNYYNYSQWWNVCEEEGALVLYIGGLAVVAVLVLVTRSRRIWKEEISMERPGNWYLMEAAFMGVLLVLCMESLFVEAIWQYSYYEEGFRVLKTDAAFDAVSEFAGSFLTVAVMYTIWYLSLYFLRPVFSLGLWEYIKEYSFVYQIFPWLKKRWKMLKDEVCHIDFSKKSTKTIVKVVAINFIVLSVCSVMWFFGIGALLIYSVILFCLIKKYYDKAGRDYQALLRAVNRMAEGDLDTEITEDLGIFEPYKTELAKVRIGFKKAVDEEVKSQRMKADLITNVSHDLKTPLTAITTYVELLKKEDITEEERRSYIDTLDKKAARLKVLIEDLFEVSKATSDNIVLHPMEVDVCNLLKQVSIEHVEKFEELGLELRWNLPEEKVILMLDNQKTFRIFENLFQNIQKYAMPGSRVYVAVKKPADETENTVEITLKNMSASELNFDAGEITERFVRGDISRNTEGSGLGLAIAKSFTEAQGGKFNIEVDGDLFKAVIVFKTA